MSAVVFIDEDFLSYSSIDLSTYSQTALQTDSQTDFAVMLCTLLSALKAL